MMFETEKVFEPRAEEPRMVALYREAVMLLHTRAEPLRVDGDDDIGFFLACIAAKLKCHGLSSLVLGVHNDALLVCRAMLEAHALLLWVTRKPDERARPWRAFALVADLRTLEKHEPQNQQMRADILSRLSGFDDVLLRKNASSSGSELGSASYVPRYPNMQLKQLFADVGMSAAYEHLYSVLSAYHHCSIEGLGRSIRFGEGWSYSPTGLDVLGFYPVMFDCIRNALLCLDHHFRLGLGTLLETLGTQFHDAAMQALADRST